MLCSLCAFFLFSSSSLQPGTQTPGQIDTFFFFFLVRSGSEIWDGLAYKRVLAGCGAAPGAEANLSPHLLCFKHQPAPAGVQGLVMRVVIGNDLCK